GDEDSTKMNQDSVNLRWVNLDQLFRRGFQKQLFNDDDFDAVIAAGNEVHETVSTTFGIPPDKLYFSHIAQFTRYKNVNNFSEFKHVDKARVPSLVVTTVSSLKMCTI